MTEQELQEMSEELAVLKMSVDTLSKRFKIALLKAKEDGQALEDESKGLPEDAESELPHECKIFQSHLKGYFRIIKEFGVEDRDALGIALKKFGIEHEVW